MIGLDRRGEHLGLGLGVIEIDHRRCVFGDQVGIARHVAFGAGKLRPVAGDHAFGLRDLRLDGAAIEREQQVALFDRLTIAEMHGHDGGIDAGLDGNAGDRRDAAERLDAHRDLFALGHGHFDRHPGGGLAFRLRRTIGGPETADEQCHANQGDRSRPE